MKNCFLILLFFAFSATAQKKTQAERQAEIDQRIKLAKYEARDSLNYETKYCLIMATGKFLSREVDIVIDYGQDGSIWQDQRIRDENGKIITFNSVMDSLNYMYSLGWEFVDAYAITVGNQNVYHYLMKRGDQMTDEFIPKTKRDFSKKK